MSKYLNISNNENKYIYIFNTNIITIQFILSHLCAKSVPRFWAAVSNASHPKNDKNRQQTTSKKSNQIHTTQKTTNLAKTPLKQTNNKRGTMLIRLAANAFIAACEVLEQEAQNAHTVAAAAYMIAFQIHNKNHMEILEAKMRKYAAVAKVAQDAAAAVREMNF